MMHDGMPHHSVWIEVDLQKVKNNLLKVQSLVNEQATVMAIVKANAYGHGMLEISKALSDIVGYFGVSTFAEGAELRESGILTPILVLGSLLPCEIKQALEHDLSFSVSDIEYARNINTYAQEAGKRAKIHIKVDTGMGRWGLVYTTAFKVIQEICSLEFINAEGLFTHFPVADVKQFDYTDRQIELFKALVDELKKKDISFQFYHAANTAGIINFEESYFNLVRPGIMIYGYYPQEYLKESLQLEPALVLKARVIHIKEFPSGRGIGYGRTYITKDKTRIGIVPVGYSHGYPYSLSQKGVVSIAGKRYCVAGSVCMDHILVDLGTDESVRVGDEVIVLGESKGEEISVYELAKKAQTIPYEIITNLNLKIPRLYINGNEDNSFSDDRDEA